VGRETRTRANHLARPLAATPSDPIGAAERNAKVLRRQHEKASGEDSTPRFRCVISFAAGVPSRPGFTGTAFLTSPIPDHTSGTGSAFLLDVSAQFSTQRPLKTCVARRRAGEHEGVREMSAMDTAVPAAPRPASRALAHEHFVGIVLFSAFRPRLAPIAVGHPFAWDIST
jgi:hypothetical protein